MPGPVHLKAIRGGGDPVDRFFSRVCIRGEYALRLFGQDHLVPQVDKECGRLPLDDSADYALDDG